MNEEAARAGCRAVRDSTLVAWYPSVYAPRTGGAYDSHHRTAGIAGRTRRRGCRMAARGERAGGHGEAEPVAARRVMTAAQATQFWQQRTNVWRRVTKK